MYPTNNPTLFAQRNFSEFEYLVRKICSSLNYKDSYEDIIQSLYLKFLTSRIIQAYNPQFNGSSIKISSYLYPIIMNFVLNKQKSLEYKMQFDLNYDINDTPFEGTPDTEDIDLVVCHNPIVAPFKHILINNDDK